MIEFDLAGAAAHFAKVAASMPRADRAVLEFVGQMVHAEAQRVIGTYDYGWPPLRQATLDHKGADTPLLETGEMRDSIRHKVTGKVAHIGSDNDKAVWQELGTSRGIPPRSFLAAALAHKIDAIIDVVGATVTAAIASGKIAKDDHDFIEWAQHFVEHSLKHAWHDLKEAAKSLTGEDENRRGRER